VAAPLIRAVSYLHAKIDRLAAGQAELREGQSEVRERLARLEGEKAAEKPRLWAPEERTR
jgi:prefoldin subunit 5